MRNMVLKEKLRTSKDNKGKIFEAVNTRYTYSGVKPVVVKA
jgi:hypothetical protein